MLKTREMDILPAQEESDPGVDETKVFVVITLYAMAVLIGFVRILQVKCVQFSLCMGGYLLS